MPNLTNTLMALSVAGALLAAPSLAEAQDAKHDGLLRMRLVAAAPAAKKTPAKPAAKATKPAPDAKAAPTKAAPASPAAPAKAAEPTGGDKADPINDPIPKLSAEAPEGGALTKLELPKDSEPPFYERGWFWPVVGVIAAAIIVTIVVAESVGGDDRMPVGTLGTIPVTL